MDLLMRMNQRLSGTEQALEKVLQEKYGELTSQPLEIAPTITTSPLTIITTMPSTIPATTIETTTGTPSTAATIAAGSSTTMTTEKLIEAMEELKLQVLELKEAKKKLAKLEISYDKTKMTVVEKTREVKTLENKVKT